MKMNRMKTKLNKAGFMLSELLVVIAILAILAGVSFVGVSTYIRNLQSLEMDETAKEILIAAQNHLSAAYASGEYEEELNKARKNESDPKGEKEFGTVISKPTYVNEVALTEEDGGKPGKHEYRAVVYPSENGNTILSYMLPQFAIDSEVSEKGKYIIVYEANSATVLSVFYSGTPHTGFGGQRIYSFTKNDIDKSENITALDEAVKSKAKRKNFTNNTVIGYFGGKNKDIIPGTTLEPLILSISNGNKLTAIVQNPNYDNAAGANNNAQIVTLTITGKTSGKSKTFQLTNAARIEFDLDDISTSGKHFNDQFGGEGLIPGEDIEGVAWLSDNSRIANPVESNHVVENSLFNSYNRYDAADGIVIISNIRHLQNLDTSISNYLNTATDIDYFTSTTEIVAKQISDINYADFIADCESYEYYGIYNNYLKEYSGTSHTIKNIISSIGNSGNSGIFGTVNRTDANKNFIMKNLDIVDCSFTSSSGCAGSAVGLASTPITFEYVNVKSEDNTKTSNISANMGGVNAAGGLIGRSTDTLTVNRCYISSDNLHILANNSGGIVGYAVAACSITDSYVEGKDFNPVGNTSGGMVGKSDTSLTISKCHVSGESLNVAGNVAGGIAGLTTGKVDIKDTYSTAYVYADVEPGGDTGGGIAGGFIGSVDSPTSDSIIERCYVSGHTKNGNFATGTQSSRETASHVDNFNIIANGIAGGFLGHSEAITVKNSYTTASVYSSNYKNLTGSKNAGGFVGTCLNLSVNNVYSAGLVSVTEGGTVGGFAGTGTISATGSNYYLRGKDSAGNGFNDVPAVGSGGTLTGVSETAGTEISVTTAAVAERWDPELPKNYTYKTVAQLSGDTNSLSDHVGDWMEIEEAEVIEKKFIRNADKLAVIFSTKEYKKGTEISLLVEGESSNASKYFHFKISNDGKSIDLNNINKYSKPLKNKENGQDTGEYEHYIYLDDVTTKNGNFYTIFTGFYPGEDLRISAMPGNVTQADLQAEAAKYYKGETTYNSSLRTGRTNSLFADGSNNATYESEDYYNDVNPEYAIVAPVEGGYAQTALITNFRHLQNLDEDVAVGGIHHDNSRRKVFNTYTHVKLCKDLYWKEAFISPTNYSINVMPKQVDPEKDEYFIDFIGAIHEDNGNTDSIKICNGGNNPLSNENSFYGINNDDIVEFDGQYHSINNLFISPKNGENAGLFRYIHFSNNDKLEFKNLTLKETVVSSAAKRSGAIIGYLCSNASGVLTINNVYSYGRYSVINSNDSCAEVGGLIGRANLGKYEINNSGASSYVYASTGDYAGGFIGHFDVSVASTISNCFVGGHVSPNDDKVYYSPDYADDIALSIDDVNVSVMREGGFNVYALNAGGFFGFSNAGNNITISNCFTTATVNGNKKNNTGAVGGFNGRINSPKKHKYNNCYVAGRIFDKAKHIAGFIGENIADSPTFTNVYVLRGESYNDDTSLKLLTGTVTIPNTIDWVDSTSANLLNTNAHMVDVTTFNRARALGYSSDEYINYPYKAWSTWPTLNDYVFYGDWVEPYIDNRQLVSLDNGNTLRAKILLTSKTSTRKPDGEGYYKSFIRIHGKDSKANVYFIVRYNPETGSVKANHVHIYNPQQFDEASNTGFEIKEECPSSKAVYDNGTLIFNIDDISKYQENYHGTMSWYGGKAGEDIFVYASSSLTGAMDDTSPNATGNSLFEELVPNNDGTNTYTAKISNARHLQNLDYEVTENTDYKISKVIQIDNIYWKDDGTFGTENYTAKTMPYLTEIPDATIYERNGKCQLTSAGKFMSLYLPQIQFSEGVDQTLVYDGNNHTLYNFDISNNTYAGDNAGLFAKVNNNLKVKDLIMKNPKVDQSATSVSSGCLVGASNNYQISLDNIALQGEVKVTGINYAGGAVGSAKNIIINNLGHDGKMNVSNVTYGHVGGMVGLADGDMTVTNSYLIGTSYDLRSLSGSYSGGIVGKVGNKFDIKDSKIETTTLNVIANTGESNVGGFAGYVGGEAKITGSNLTATNATISGDDGNTKVGGYIGYAGGDASISTSNFTVTSATIEGKYGMSYVGGYIGYANTKGTLENSKIDGKGRTVTITCIGDTSAYAGGLVGYANTDLILNNMKFDFSNGSFNVNASCISAQNSYAGGFAGHVQNSITCDDSELKASNATIISDHITGGLFASIGNSANITNSSVHGTNMSIEGGKYVGGVLGTFEGNNLSIDNVFGYGVKTAYLKLVNDEGNSAIGGFIARTDQSSNMNITNSFSSYVIEAVGTGVLGAGGFGGSLSGTGNISCCYVSSHLSSDHDISSNALYTGGFVGSILGSIKINKSFTTSIVSATGNIYVGGFAGTAGNGAKIKEGCYTVGTVKKSTNSINGAFIGYLATQTEITGTYYFDKYSNSMNSVGSNDYGVYYEIGKATYNSYGVIQGYGNTYTDLVHAWDETLTAKNAKYIFNNWVNSQTDTQVIYGDWDYDNLPSKVK